MSSFPLNPQNTNTFGSAAVVVARLTGQLPVTQRPFVYPYPSFMPSIAASRLNASSVPAAAAASASSAAAAASSLVQRCAPMTDVGKEKEIQSLSELLEAAKKRLTDLKTTRIAGVSGIQSMGAEMEQLKAKMEKAQEDVAQCAEDIEEEESNIKAREAFLERLKQPKKKVEKRKVDEKPSAHEMRAESASTLAESTPTLGEGDDAVKRQRMTPEASVVDLPLLIPLHQEAAAAASSSSSSSAAASQASISIASAAEPATSLVPHISSEWLGKDHSSIDQVLAEVFVSGTVVQYNGEEAVIQRYDENKKQFIIKQEEKEYSVPRQKILYLPKVGQKILMREMDRRDAHRRLYTAEVIKAGKPPAGATGIRKCAFQIQVKWLEYKSAESDLVTYETLDKLLPINAENPITDKLRYRWVKWDEKGLAKGYFLAYGQPATNATT